MTTPRSQPHPPAEAGPLERSYANCPILAGLSQITSLAQDIRATTRQLRRDLNRCKTCPLGQQCPIMQQYQEQISQAIADVLAEFSRP
jgi:hypothetical protein